MRFISTTGNGRTTPAYFSADWGCFRQRENRRRSNFSLPWIFLPFATFLFDPSISREKSSSKSFHRVSFDTDSRRGSWELPKDLQRWCLDGLTFEQSFRSRKMRTSRRFGLGRSERLSERPQRATAQSSRKVSTGISSIIP